MVNGVRGFVEDAVGRLIRSDEFQQAWAGQLEAHDAAVLTGKTGEMIQVEGNTVSVNLAAVIDAVKTRLQDAGFALAEPIPTVNAQFTIMESADITRAQTALTLSALARALPIVALLLLAVAVAPSSSSQGAGHRGLGRRVDGPPVRCSTRSASSTSTLSHRSGSSPAAAAAIYDQLVGSSGSTSGPSSSCSSRSLSSPVTGPWASAAAVRRAAGRAVDTVRHGSDRVGLDTGAFGVALYNMRTLLRAGVFWRRSWST